MFTNIIRSSSNKSIKKTKRKLKIDQVLTSMVREALTTVLEDKSSLLEDRMK